MRATLVTILFAPSLALAWHDTGHMVAAEIAYRSMTEAARKRAAALLKIGGDAKTRDFVMASCWADDVKSDKDAPWHYINYFFRPDGKPTENKPLEENVVWAIRQMTAKLKSDSVPEPEKADALRYLIHFVGDIHQPLHNVARVTDKLPAGDRGGNDFPITPPAGLDPQPRNLHFLWDMGAGTFKRIQRPLDDAGYIEIGYLADYAMKLYPDFNHRNAIAQLDPELWSKEGLDLARSRVYGLEEGSVPSQEYLEMCREVSLKQVALAGYRLAGLLNSIFGR